MTLTRQLAYLAGVLASGVLWLTTARVSLANDGAISYGGSPSLLNGHPSVAMQNEVVRMAISKETVTVDCRFVFKNHGKACEVRMGFPDRGEGGDDPDEEYGDPEWKTKPAKTTFNWFKSYVDGKQVKTQLIRSNKAGEFWHAKTVRFAAGQTRTVRDVYNVDVGGQVAPNGLGWFKQTSYILHTGKSWHGKIGRSEVIVTFSPQFGASQLRPTWHRFSEAGFAKVNWKSLTNGKLLYHGPGVARVNGRTMRFVRTNWEPSEKDDIWLAFDLEGAQTNTPTARLPYVHEYPFNRALRESDLKGKTDWQLRLMRNAIYARHGRPFQDEKLAKYFEAQKWYRKNRKWSEADDNAKLTSLEKQNADFILRYAEKH